MAVIKYDYFRFIEQRFYMKYKILVTEFLPKFKQQNINCKIQRRYE